MGSAFAETIHGHTIDLDLTKVGIKERQKQETITNLCTDIFLIVIRMREAEDLGDPSALRKLLMHYIELFRKNCTALNITKPLIDDAIYALVALLDETVMSVPGRCRDFWIVNPVQLELYNDNLAGQGFYTRLDSMLADPEKMKDVLEIYYLCLCVGFEGKYRLGSATERENVIDNLARVLLKINKRAVAGLSPHGRRAISQNFIRRSVTKKIPLWVVCIILIVLLGLWWGGMMYMTEESVEKVLEAIK